MTFKLSDENKALSELNLPQLQAEAATFAEPWKTAWTKIPDGTRVPNNRISVWSPIPLPDGAMEGSVALVGDAGHAMTFHRGQGMKRGIADAVKLSNLLGELRSSDKSGEEAIAEYEREMIERAGEEEVKIVNMDTEMMHDWTRPQRSMFMQRGGGKLYK